MAKTKTSWTKGQSGNPAGRLAGTGRVAEYRALLEPHVPAVLSILAEKAKGGDLVAIRLLLDRVYPAKDAAFESILQDIEELRGLVEMVKAARQSTEANFKSEES